MAFTTTKSLFWQGFRDSAPFVLVAGPFGMLFGIVAMEAGFDLIQVLAFSAAVFAGAAQLTAVQLMQDQTPTIIVLISALAVNLRVAMYSASLTPYLGGAPLWQRACAAYLIVDQSYALSITRFEAQPAMTGPERMTYFFGTNGLIAPVWCLATYIGAVAGSRLPETLDLTFVIPLAFLAMIVPMLRTMAHVLAMVTAIVVALLAAGVPYNLGLIIAGTCGMMAGAQAELWLERRGLPT
jgi:predicted branched-subunit amino acid permease